MIFEDEQNYIRNARNGDSKAFSYLVEKYAGELYGYLFRFTGNHSDTDDLLQDVFLNAFNNLNQFTDGTSFKSWIYAIARNGFLNFTRKRKNEKHTTESAGLEKNWETSGADTIKGELDREIQKAIQTLPEQLKQVVLLFIIEGFSHREIADITGASEETVRWRLFKARQKLKELLNDYL